MKCTFALNANSYECVIEEFRNNSYVKYILFNKQLKLLFTQLFKICIMYFVKKYIIQKRKKLKWIIWRIWYTLNILALSVEYTLHTFDQNFDFKIRRNHKKNSAAKGLYLKHNRKMKQNLKILSKTNYSTEK